MAYEGMFAETICRVGIMPPKKLPAVLLITGAGVAVRPTRKTPGIHWPYV